MAINISDMDEIQDEPHIGDRLPIEMLFRAIEERWSVVADRIESLPEGCHPLAYDRFPTRQDRLDAIRANVCALAPYFVNLDDDANQPTGWARCPLPYSADDIARSGLDANGHGHVLLVPARGAVWGEWEAAWYYPFLKSAAYWLAKFRYVFAGPWTCVFGKLKREISGTWYDYPDWYERSLWYEGYTINGEEHMTTYEDGAWHRCDSFEDVIAETVNGDDAVVTEAPPEKPVWGIPSAGIPIATNANASTRRYRVTDEDGCVAVVHYPDGTWSPVATKYGWSETIEVSFSVSGVPAKVVVANPFGYRADLIFVYAPKSTQNGERKQETSIVYTNGYENTSWREILGTFYESDKYVKVGNVYLKEYHADFDPTTGRKVVVNDETGESDTPLDKNGDDVWIRVSRYNEPDSFGVFPIGDPEAEDPSEQATAPAGKANRIEIVAPIDPGSTASKEFGKIPKPSELKGYLLVRSTVDIAAMIEDAQGFRVDNGPGLEPYMPTPYGFNYRTDYSSDVMYWDAGCRIVPILDFGEAYMVEAEEEIENWAGVEHDQEGGDEEDE